MQITGGYLKSRKIASPKGANVRPTLSQIRESVFSILKSLINFDGAVFLDAFSGSGIMGFEAISRGFENAVLIEKDRKTFFLLKQNASKLALNPVLYAGDTLKILEKINMTFDVIYIDPPYREGFYEKILRVISEKSLLKSAGFIVLEHLKETEIDFCGFNMVKQKSYGEKVLTILNQLS